MESKEKFKLVTSKKTRYLLPNILTLGGVCLGISSIKFSIDGNFSLAVTLILFAAILDALDGRIARLIKGTSEFGKELDSLTDFVSFGIAPVFILYFWELNTYGKLGWAITLIYSVCCVLRLARFNLTKTNQNQESNTVCQSWCLHICKLCKIHQVLRFSERTWLYWHIRKYWALSAIWEQK